MAALPSGSVTFLLTDIEGSTPLLRRLGDRYLPLLERHERLLRAVWDQHGGVEFKSEGDALLVAFESAADACAAAVAGQALLRAEPWPPDAVIKVRMGIHTGIAYPRRGDYVALALHQAARVVGAANGGQALASAATVAAAARDAPGVRFDRLGVFRLRDFDGPVELWSVNPVGGGPEDEVPAIRAVPADGHNLRRPTDAFVGRRREQGEIAELVLPGRAVTLVGPGGMGKTRLAIELGLAIAPAWSGGVWFVDLTSVPEGRSIGSTVADALGVTPRQEDPVADVVEHLGVTQTLLVLDNCEHVVTSARALASAVLTGCPNTALLATSRERLEVPGEQTYLLAPLGTVDEGVELFEQRSREQDASFRLDAADRAVVERICVLLDAMPLAIELAAARTTVLTPSEILDGLERRLTSLRSRSEVLSPRQRSLDALLDWSYELLSPDERAVLRRLSVFGAGFDLETAAAAVGWGEVPRDDVPELVWALVAKSLALVERTEMSTRYRLLRTIRAVAAEHVRRAAEAPKTRVALAEHYFRVFPLDSRGKRAWRAQLDAELVTMSELVGLLIGDGEVELAYALARLVVEHEIGLSLSKGLVAVDAALGTTDKECGGRARLELIAAKLRAEAGDVEAAAASLGRALEQLERSGDVDRFGRIEPLHAKTQLVLRAAGPEDMARLDDELVAALAGDVTPMERADLLNDRALVAGARGLDGSPFLEEAAAIAERLDDHMLWMMANNNLAEHDLRAGDTAAAARHQREAMRLSAELGVPLVTAFGLVVAARIAQPLGLDAEAVRLHAAADVMLDEIGFQLMFDDRDLSDEMLAAARGELGDDFDVEAAAGRALTLVDALGLAELVYDKVAPPAGP